MVPRKTMTNSQYIVSLRNHSGKDSRVSRLSRVVQVSLDILQHILLLLAFLMFFSYIQVATAATQTPVPGLYASEQGTGIPVSLKAANSELEMKIEVMTNHAVFNQNYSLSAVWNDTKGAGNGTYVFLLHKDAVLEEIAILVNQQQVYEYSSQQSSSNLDISTYRNNKIYQIRNLNLGSDGVIQTRLRYHQPVKYQQGRFVLVIPMTDRLNTQLHVELNAGFAVGQIISPTHAIHIADHGSGRYSIRFQDDNISENDEFELFWTPERDFAPVATNNLAITGTRSEVTEITQSINEVQLKLLSGLMCVCLAWSLRVLLLHCFSERNFHKQYISYEHV